MNPCATNRRSRQGDQLVQPLLVTHSTRCPILISQPTSLTLTLTHQHTLAQLMYVPTTPPRVVGRPSADAPVSVVESEYSDPFEYPCGRPSGDSPRALSPSPFAINSSSLCPPASRSRPSLAPSSSPTPLPPAQPQSQATLPPPQRQSHATRSPPRSRSRITLPLPPPRSLTISRPAPHHSLPPPTTDEVITDTDVPSLPSHESRYLHPRDPPPRPKTRPYSWGLGDVDLLPSPPPAVVHPASLSDEGPVPPSTAASPTSRLSRPASWLPATWSPRSSLLQRRRVSRPALPTPSPPPPKTQSPNKQRPLRRSVPLHSISNNHMSHPDTGALDALDAPTPPSAFLHLPGTPPSGPVSRRSSPASFTAHINANANTAPSECSSDRRVAAWLATPSPLTSTEHIQHSDQPISPSPSSPCSSDHAHIHQRIKAPPRRPSIQALLTDADTDPRIVPPWPAPPPRPFPPSLITPPKAHSAHCGRARPRPRLPPIDPDLPPLPPPLPFDAPIPSTPPPPPPSRVYDYPAVASCPSSPTVNVPAPLTPPGGTLAPRETPGRTAAGEGWWGSFPLSVTFSGNTKRSERRRPPTAFGDVEKGRHRQSVASPVTPAAAETRASVVWKEYPVTPLPPPATAARGARGREEGHKLTWSRVCASVLIYLATLFRWRVSCLRRQRQPHMVSRRERSKGGESEW